MAKIEEYRELIQAVLIEYCQLLDDKSDDETEVQTVFDTVRDHYQLVHVGFHGKQRQYGCLFHADLKNGKIWIQHDSTDLGIGDQFLMRGVPKNDIVLGYYTPTMRKFSEFAVT